MESKDVEVEGNYMSHLALDLGGSLIKFVYFSRNSDIVDDDEKAENYGDEDGKHPLLRGRLHFTKFKYIDMNDCLDFISSKMLHLDDGRQPCKAPTGDKKIAIIKATGGGAHKFSSIFEEKLGIGIKEEDEFDSIVGGASFLLKNVPQEAFTHMNGETEYVQIDNDDLYPYIIVHMGTGVTVNKVDAGDKCEPIGGTDIGGGTFWGLGRLLTKCNSFDELLELSQHGNNQATDIFAADINGGRDYSRPGMKFMGTLVASGFGKAMYDNKELEDYKPEDIACALLRMISNNIGQMGCSSALRFGLKRVFFSGSFIQSHSTMDIISDVVHLWSRGSVKAVFLRHRGFVQAIGAFLKYKNHNSNGVVVHNKIEEDGDLSDELSIECSLYAQIEELACNA